MLNDLLVAALVGIAVNDGTYDGRPRDTTFVRIQETVTPAAPTPPPPAIVLHPPASSTPGIASPVHGTGTGYYSGPVAIDTARMPDATYALFDPTRGIRPNPVLLHEQADANGWSSTGMQVWYDEHDVRARSTGGNYLFQFNPLNVWGDGRLFTEWGHENDANGQSAGVDALHAMQATWDFYAQVFGRIGMDGQGTSVFAQVLLSPSPYIDNGFWGFGTYNGLLLGAGSWPSNPEGYSSFTDLDFIAREMTHGVIYSTARLYPSFYEEGALEQATCDFFAQMVKAWLTNPGPTIPDADLPWEIGRGIGHGTPLRSMVKPSSDGRSPDGWYDGLNYIDA